MQHQRRVDPGGGFASQADRIFPWIFCNPQLDISVINLPFFKRR